MAGSVIRWHGLRIDIAASGQSRGRLGDLFMATYLNPESDVMPCASCGRDVSGLLIQSMTIDVACSCGAPIVIGRAMGDDANERSVEARIQL